MDQDAKFVARLNIAMFDKRLRGETDPAKRAAIEALRATEKAKFDRLARGSGMRVDAERH